MLLNHCLYNPNPIPVPLLDYFSLLDSIDDHEEYVNEQEFTPIDFGKLEDVPDFGQDHCNPETPNLLNLFKHSDQVWKRRNSVVKLAAQFDSPAVLAPNTESTNAKDTDKNNLDTQHAEVQHKHEELKVEKNQVQPKCSEEDAFSMVPNNWEYDPSESEYCIQDYSEKQARWGRDQDKILFSTIREMERRGEINYNEILEINPSIWHARCPEIKELCCRVKWKRAKKDLVHRIQKLSSRTKMSVREEKLFKKIIKRDYKQSNIDSRSVLFHFPGKTVEILERHYESICE